jgi:hypothetical protein
MEEAASEDGTPARQPPFISRVRLKNYKSIASCDVRLGPLTILVGPNGTGKSNYLDCSGIPWVVRGRAEIESPSEPLGRWGPGDRFWSCFHVGRYCPGRCRARCVVPALGTSGPSTADRYRGTRTRPASAAAGVLFDALTEASEHVQVIATSQSADLLDREELDVSVIRPVTMQGGLTLIGEVDGASREIVEKKLYTLGELMRGNQLSPVTAPRCPHTWLSPRKLSRCSPFPGCSRPVQEQVVQQGCCRHPRSSAPAGATGGRSSRTPDDHAARSSFCG